MYEVNRVQELEAELKAARATGRFALWFGLALGVLIGACGYSFLAAVF